MSQPLPVHYLVRHGGTEWSATGQHTGRTDIPLTPEGEMEAGRLRPRLHALNFTRVYTSPLQRARRTCELVGFGDLAVVDPDLTEWDYGAYEGRRTVDIREECPDWDLFRDGCPNGENAAQVGARVDRVIDRLRRDGTNTLLMAHAHVLRVLAARWIGLAPEGGRLLVLGTVSLSALSYDHGLDEPVVRLWNDRSHLETPPRS
jgi:broad specificity phosphatase PhoE